MNSSLVVVGSGIKFLAHMTNETRAYILESDKVLYLVNDPVMKQWISENNAHSESLDPLYTKFPLRKDCYHAITEYILSELNKIQHVCVVLYGHPSVFAQPGLDAVIKAREQGFYAKILPGISAEDCLFADLLIDPGSIGCHSFEASDFLLHKRKFDSSCHLILWQVDVIGMLDHGQNQSNEKGLACLVNYLSHYYALSHQIILYEAAQYPSFEPVINYLALRELPKTQLSRIMTLYIPPASKAKYDKTILRILNMDLKKLKKNNHQ